MVSVKPWPSIWHASSRKSILAALLETNQRVHMSCDTIWFFHDDVRGHWFDLYTSWRALVSAGLSLVSAGIRTWVSCFCYWYCFPSAWLGLCRWHHTLWGWEVVYVLIQETMSFIYILLFTLQRSAGMSNHNCPQLVWNQELNLSLFMWD